MATETDRELLEKAFAGTAGEWLCGDEGWITEVDLAKAYAAIPPLDGKSHHPRLGTTAQVAEAMGLPGQGSSRRVGRTLELLKKKRLIAYDHRRRGWGRLHQGGC